MDGACNVCMREVRSVHEVVVRKSKGRSKCKLEDNIKNVLAN
jgi:hypothetical protein